MKSRLLAMTCLLMATISAKAIEIEITAGTEFDVKTINRSDVQTGERSIVLLRPRVASPSLAQGVEQLPEYCVLSANMTLNSNRGLVIANHLLCVTEEKVIVEADVEGIVNTVEGENTVPVECLQRSNDRCVRARLEPSNEFKFVISEDVTLTDQ
ncbi:hypothetical protein [Salinibius halmophilus]|uniref:hypothetical protein n=1 Tax=Salinibius halmophilus TaxID=1853216 RepID=UPI000E663ECF|nr:hypothetical protein [Salinibius halmophilus]